MKNNFHQHLLNKIRLFILPVTICFNLNFYSGFSQTFSIDGTAPSATMEACGDDAEFTVTATYIGSSIMIFSDVDPLNIKAVFSSDGNGGVNYKANSIIAELISGGTTSTLPATDYSVIDTDPGAPVFSFKITLSSNDKIQIKFKGIANCDIIPSRAPGAPVVSVSRTFKAEVVFQNVKIAEMASGKSYNIIYGDISIPVSGSDQSVNASMYETITRNIPVKNSLGAGKVSFLNYEIYYPTNALTQIKLEIIDINNTIAKTLTSSTTTVGNMVKYSGSITPADFYDIIGTSSLDADKLFYISETVKILACSPVIETTYKVTWGCDDSGNNTGSGCNLDDASAQNAEAKIYINQPLASPDPTITYQVVTPGSYCNNNGPSIVRYSYSNNNAGFSNTILNNSFGINFYGHLNIQSVKIDFDHDGQYEYTLSSPSSNYTPFYFLQLNDLYFPAFDYDPDGPSNGLEDIDGDNYYDDLAPGQYLNFEVEFITNCQAVCGENSENLGFYSSFTGICSDPDNILYKYAPSLQSNYYRQANSFTSGPVDIVEGIPSTFSFSNNFYHYTNFFETCYNENYFVELIVPDGFFLAIPNNASFNGTPVNAIQSGNLITLTGGSSNGIFALDLTISCAGFPSGQEPANGSVNLDWKLKHKCDETADGSSCSCVQLISCESFSTYTHFKCPGSGTTQQCITSTSFIAERASFGHVLPGHTGPWFQQTLEDATMLTRTTIDPAIHKLDRVYEFDTILLKVPGKILSLDCNLDEVHVSITYTAPGNTGLLEFIAGQFDVNGHIYNVTASDLLVSSNANQFTLDFTLPSLQYLTLNGTVDFSGTFWVKKDDNIPTESKYSIPNFRAAHYGKYQNTVFGNESFGATMSILKPVKNFYLNSTFISSCVNSQELIFYVQGGAQEDDFPGEFRSLARPNQYSTVLPTGFSYIPNTAKIKLWGQNDFTVPLADEPAVSGNSIVFTRKADWPLLDKDKSSSYWILEYHLQPACNSPAGPINLQYDLSYNPFDYTFLCPGQNGIPQIQDCEVNATVQFHMPYSKPILELSAENNQPGIADEVTWTVKLENKGGLPTAFTWINVVTDQSNTSTIIIAKAEDESGNVFLPILNGNNFFFEVGSVDAYDYRKIFITATYENCGDGTVDRLDLQASWNCGSYPLSISPADLVCTPLTSYLTLTTKAANMQHTIKEITQSPTQICAEHTYELEVFSTGLANMYDVSTTVNLSENATGVSLVAGSSKVYYPVSNATGYQIIPTVTGNEIAWDFSTIQELQPFIPGSSFKLKFSLVTNCDVDINNAIADIQTTGKTNCNTPISFLDQPVLTIEGIPTNHEVDLALAGNDFVTEGGSTKVNLMFSNLSNTNSTPDHKIKVSIPPLLKYVAGSASPAIASNVTEISGETILKWNAGVINPSENLLISFFVKDFSTASDPGPVTITAESYYLADLVCNEGACEKEIVSAEADIILNLWKEPEIPVFPPPVVQCKDCIGSFAPYHGRKYVLSAWVKESASLTLTAYLNPAISLFFEGSNQEEGPFKASGEIIDGWQRIEAEFTVPDNSTNININLQNYGDNDVFFDDIRIYPFNGNMKSFVYDPINLRLMAELDENNYATFYEYDEEGALVRVKKETVKGVQTIKESRNNSKKTMPNGSN